MCDYSTLINRTVGHNVPSLVGRFYREAISGKWYQITGSEPVFTELNYSIGYRWPTLRHRITGKKPATRAQVKKLMTCSKSDFYKMIA